MPDTTSIGALLDSRGLLADLDPDDLVADAVVLLRVVQPDGSTALTIAATPSLDWVGQLGLLHAALGVMAATGYSLADGE